MATSRRRNVAATFGEQALALAASAWTELGVSGWASSHADWAIDPEPLIIFTAWLGDRDPRLRDEATDWCIRNGRYVSRARLKNLLRAQPADVQDAFGEFAATVAGHAGSTWPGASTARPFKVTGRSTLPPLERPSMAWVRLRAMFGVGARSELLRCFLSRRGAMSVARLAETTGFTKRNVADECDTLQLAGVLSVKTTGNRQYYSLVRRAELERFVGAIAASRPDWTALLNVTRKLVVLEALIEHSSAQTVPVHSRTTIRALEDDLSELDVETELDDVRGADLWPALRRFGTEHLGAWSIGEWPTSSSTATRSS